MGPSQQKPVSKTENEELPKIAHEVFANRELVRSNNDEEYIVVKLGVAHQR